MISALIHLCFLGLLSVPGLAAESATDSWSTREMGDPGEAEGAKLQLRLLPEGKAFPPNFRCEDTPSPCEFKLAYFLGNGFDVDKKQRRNILYIPGGPGAIVDSESRPATLRLLEKKHNVVYFHPRGMGQSVLDGRKEYDQFLRADYVVDDIEKLRQAVLEARPWDAIYGHSWGTVIAQRYAAKYGRPKDPTPKVRSLILSGPVDRHRSDTHGARTRMTIENLKAIFQYYRSKDAAPCRCESTSFLKPIVTDFSNPQITIRDSHLGPNDNLCFLTIEVVDRIVKQLEKIIPEIDENYGSADFVVDHFSVLKKDPGFHERLGRFPIEFFAALRYLQMSGAPEKPALVFAADSRNRINAALLIAHYLTAESPSRCRSKDALASAAAPGDCEYCERFRAAREELRLRMTGGESQRGNYVYGVYDGVARWISTVMGEKACFSGRDMEKFAAQSSGEKGFARDQVKKIGIVADEKICPWNPADYRHEVPTLLLKGSRDTVVAGCQAEDFYKNGIHDRRGVLLEFRGLGHDLSVANLYYGDEPSFWSMRFANLLEDFIRMSSSPTKFRSDSQLKAKLLRLNVKDRSDEPKLTVNCGKIP